MHRLAWLIFISVTVGCSTDSTWTYPSTSHSLAAGGERVDLHFQPLDLRDGESVEVKVGSLRLRSAAEAGEHRVAMTGSGQKARGVVGLLDGKPQLTSESHPHAGTTSLGPTSVHRYTDCRDGECTERVEFDYDLNAPSGDGTTSWRTLDGRSATIDRLRFELDAAPAQQKAELRLVTPEPAIIVGSSTRVQ